MALSGISVVLCCTHQDEAHLSAVVEHLRRESIEPVILAGVDEDTHRLGNAVDNERGRALFVLCKSSALGSSEVLRLEGIFGARKGPSHRMIAAPLKAEDPLGMLRDIRAALSGFTRSRSSFEDSDDDAAPMREVVNISGISAVGSDARSVTPMRERLASRETPADPLAIPMRGKAGEHAARVPAHQSGGWRTDADVGDTVSEKRAPLAADENGNKPASLLPEPMAPRANMLMPALVGGLLVAVLGVGVVLLTRDAPPPPAAAREVARAPSPPPAAIAPAPQPASPPPATQPAGAGPATESTGSEETGEDPAGETGPGEGDAEPAGDPSPGPDAKDEEIAISEAIANGEMRALDLLLVSAADKARPWRKAVDHCKLKRVNGVKGWRLPSLAELKKLRAARMLKPGRYWSGTKGVSGADVYVLDRSSRKVELVPKEADDVLPLCVRPR